MNTAENKTSEAVGENPANISIKPTNLPRPKPISVNGVTISRAAIGSETQNHPASKPIEAWLAAARALVIRELLLQEAKRLNVEPSPLCDDEGRRETDDEAIIRQVVEQEVKTPEPDEAACRRIYESQKAKFRSSDLYGVRHILFAAPPGNKKSRAEARTMAEIAIKTATEEPARFGELAASLSACPSREQGGNLGQVSRGQTVKEFEEALALAPVGRVAPEPVETRYGFHVILVEAKREGKQLPFEVVQSRIAEWLGAAAQHTALRQYISVLAGRAEIKGIALEGATTSPLVQ